MSNLTDITHMSDTDLDIFLGVEPETDPLAILMAMGVLTEEEQAAHDAEAAAARVARHARIDEQNRDEADRRAEGRGYYGPIMAILARQERDSGEW